MLWATTHKNTHELKSEHFSALLPKERKNDWCCMQPHRTFFCVVGNNMEELPNEEQYNIFL
jgi:hypothetical protein